MKKRSSSMNRHVIWDWNGTLLDDVDACVDTLNQILATRGREPVNKDFYRAYFGFPVRDFYANHLALDMSPKDFEELSHLFISTYRGFADRFSLYPDVHAALGDLKRRGVRQSVLSAMEHGLLGRMLEEHALAHIFDNYRGLSDHTAHSKVALGVEAISAWGGDPRHALFVGDTLHDLETAQAMGCECVLFGGGHQCPTRLRNAHTHVVETWPELVRFLKTWVEGEVAPALS